MASHRNTAVLQTSAKHLCVTCFCQNASTCFPCLPHQQRTSSSTSKCISKGRQMPGTRRRLHPKLKHLSVDGVSSSSRLLSVKIVFVLKAINLQTVRHRELPDCYDFTVFVCDQIFLHAIANCSNEHEILCDASDHVCLGGTLCAF